MTERIVYGWGYTTVRLNEKTSLYDVECYSTDEAGHRIGSTVVIGPRIPSGALQAIIDDRAKQLSVDTDAAPAPASPPPPPCPRDNSMDRFWTATGAVRLRGGWFGPRLEVEETRVVDRRPSGAAWSPGWLETEFRWRRARADELSIPLREATGPSMTTLAFGRAKGR